MQTPEIEARFLEVDAEAIGRKLRELGAEDRGETVLEEVIVYDADSTWAAQNRFVRLRRKNGVTELAYKEHSDGVEGATEINLGVESLEKAVAILEKVGLRPFRRQQKRRHSFELGEVQFDLDTWPRIPTYLEIEGPTLELVRGAAEALGFDWTHAVFKNAALVIEEDYGIPVRSLSWFTFDRVE